MLVSSPVVGAGLPLTAHQCDLRRRHDAAVIDGPGALGRSDNDARLLGRLALQMELQIGISISTSWIMPSIVTRRPAVLCRCADNSRLLLCLALPVCQSRLEFTAMYRKQPCISYVRHVIGRQCLLAAPDRQAQHSTETGAALVKNGHPERHCAIHLLLGCHGSDIPACGAFVARLGLRGGRLSRSNLPSQLPGLRKCTSGRNNAFLLVTPVG